jgi:hypothetical protein
MKNVIFLIFLFCCCITTNAQSIVSGAQVTKPFVFLGESTSLTFNVNKVTSCDTYTIEWDINYIAKSIEVKVKYNYFSNCTTSGGTFIENISKPILLNGFYTMKITVNSLFNFNLNQTVFLQSVFVNTPVFLNCNNSFIPTLIDVCPSLLSPVCACNGQTYQNECMAYLKDRNGNYIGQNCPLYISQNKVDFKCKTYEPFQDMKSNFFEKYSCSNDLFQGKELFLEYEHKQLSDYRLEYTTQSSTVRVFLTSLENNNIKCIASSNNGVLEVPKLPSGTYFIISDNKLQQDYSITFCKATYVDELKQDRIVLFPNPSSGLLSIRNDSGNITSVAILDSLGDICKFQVINDSKIDIDLSNLLPAFYIAQIQLQNGNSVFKKFLIQ